MGSGRGVWLAQWQEAWVEDVLAIDGDYVDRDALAIPQNQFMAADLTKPVTLKRKFELAQSLEVGEHLPTSAAETLVDSLTKASDRVLFPLLSQVKAENSTSTNSSPSGRTCLLSAAIVL